LGLAGFPLHPRLLHVRDGGAEGALQLGALLVNIRQGFEPFLDVCDALVDALRAVGEALEQPLGSDIGFQV
jgi:hypothetical protein